ncbi:DUF935 domain-containing protein [Pandoraea apista]|uniref:DUF935 domain-containing protein n=1 Tax=Pandoraea apista TaxID=93218 RepID=UPI000F65CD20|nr:DUF935 domain-containing protein [Pandoraea apista]RRW90604.1 DUF935 domain-containing protein [Pandoraea apista]RRX00396.1 DUF935 domain-containing protein [Pandoraea apista]
MGRIVDLDGNSIEDKVLHTPQTSELGWITRSFDSHPARGLTFDRLHNLLAAAEQGHLLEQSDLFADMEERDGHIAAEMSKRKRVLLTLDYDIKPPRDASAAEKHMAQQVREWLEDMPEFETLLLDCLDAIGHGFSAQEIEWQRLGSMWFPKAFHHRPQRWFMNPIDDREQIRLIGPEVGGLPLWPAGWVVHRHRGKSGYIARCGLHRALCWPYLFKNFATRDLAEFLNIYGLPLRLGKYTPGASKEEKDALLRAVKGIGRNAAGIIPQEMVIEFEEAAAGTHVPHTAMIEWCERTQSKVILGGTLTSQADGKTSTNALGNVHNEVRHDLMTSDARQLERTITRDLIYTMIVLNVGPIDRLRCPRFEFETREVADIRMYADALPKLVGMGAKIQRKWVHEKLSIPEPEDGDELLTIPRPELSVPPDMRPAERLEMPRGVKTAANSRTSGIRYVAVMTNERGETVYADQHMLDEAMDALPAQPVNDAMTATLAPVIEAIHNGATPDDAMEQLLEAHPQMDTGEIAELLSRAMFAAEVWGRIHGG